MKSYDNTFVGDVYVRYENDSLFRYLYVINDEDTLYSINRNSFFNKDGKLDTRTADIIYGYTFSEMGNAYFTLIPRNENGEHTKDTLRLELNYTNRGTILGFRKHSANNDSGFEKVYTMKKKDNTVIGDIYVKYMDYGYSSFKYLYVINDGDTLCSVKNDDFFDKNGIVNTIGRGVNDHIFLKKSNDYFYITSRNEGEGECWTNNVRIGWNYKDNILEFWRFSVDNDSNGEFEKIYTMKKNNSTVVGDVYAKFDNEITFRYLYIINDKDTLYSIKNNVFESKNGMVDYTLMNNISGYSFMIMDNDYFLLSSWYGECRDQSCPPLISWNYDDNIIESFVP